VRAERVVAVVDCGIVINPDTAKAQIEGGILFGLSAALAEEITLTSGAVVQQNFHDYPLLRLNEAPAVEVEFIASSQPPGGLGEPGTPPIAPALVNAVFAATGVRLRALPLAASTAMLGAKPPAAG
jgi:isoquinoline 1-oxidoreductase beta subunit